VKPLALSTMFAQQDRFRDGAAFARFAAEAGYDAIEISHSTPEEKLVQILEANLLPVTSVHQPAPWVQHHDGRGNSSCNLASTAEEERAAAIDYAKRSIARAAVIGATHVVVHLGAVGDSGMFEEEREMRRMFDSGRAEDRRFAHLRERAIERRRREAGPYVAIARRSLLELVEVARPHGIVIGIENRYHFHEIPAPDEYDIILEGLTRDEAGYWHDVGHAEVLHRLGLFDRHAWFAAAGEHLVGAHLHDVVGLGDHRAPGEGDIDWAYVREGLATLPRYTLEINQRRSDEAVRQAPEFLESVGLR
jgi:sugar phosphate isomerase/epimerase